MTTVSSPTPHPFKVIQRCSDCLVRDPSGWVVDGHRIYCLRCAAERYWRCPSRWFAAAAVVDWKRMEAEARKGD